MSGHNQFTWWITKCARYALVDGKRCAIASTYFTTGDGSPNSDMLVVVLKDKRHIPFDNKGMASDFWRRWRKYCRKEDRHAHVETVEPLKEYHKLVRDNVPEIIRAKGQIAITHVADDEEYRKKLREKLVEESGEYLRTGDVEELADVIEVIDAIVTFECYKPQALESVRRTKAKVRGQFATRTILERA